MVGADAAGRQALSQLLCQAYDGELKGNGAFGGFGRRQVDVLACRRGCSFSRSDLRWFLVAIVVAAVPGRRGFLTSLAPTAVRNSFNPLEDVRHPSTNFHSSTGAMMIWRPAS